MSVVGFRLLDFISEPRGCAHMYTHQFTYIRIHPQVSACTADTGVSDPSA